jgi:hypothetical protein
MHKRQGISESSAAISCLNFGHTRQLQYMPCNHVTQLAKLIFATGFCSQFKMEKLPLMWLFSLMKHGFIYADVSSKNNQYRYSVNTHLKHKVNFSLFNGVILDLGKSCSTLQRLMKFLPADGKLHLLGYLQLDALLFFDKYDMQV